MPSLTLSQHDIDHLGSSYCSICHMLIVQLPGLALGGVWGVREGARRPLAVSNTRLRINSILNSVTRRGTFIGNSAGVLGMSPAFPALSTLSYCLTDRNQLQHLYTTGLIRRSTPCAGSTTYLAAWQRAQSLADFTSRQV